MLSMQTLFQVFLIFFFTFCSFHVAFLCILIVWYFCWNELFHLHFSHFLSVHGLSRSVLILFCFLDQTPYCQKAEKKRLRQKVLFCVYNYYNSLVMLRLNPCTFTMLASNRDYNKGRAYFSQNRRITAQRNTQSICPCPHLYHILLS